MENDRVNRIINIGLAFCVMLISSCAPEIYQDSESPEIIRLSCSTTQLNTTRGSVNIQNATFDQGETVNVYITHSSDDATPVGNTPNVYTADANGKLEITPPVYYPPGTNSNVNIRAYYPSTKVTTASTSFTVEDSQVSDADYSLSDLMYAEVLNQAKTSSDVQLQFSHLLSKVIIEATGDDAVNIMGISFTGVYKEIGFTAVDGTIGASSTLASQGDVAVASSSGASQLSGAAILPPQSLSGNFLVVSTDKGDATFNLATAKPIAAGLQYTLQVTVGRQSINHVNPIVAWNDTGTQIVNAGDNNQMSISGTIESSEYTGYDITPTPDVYYGSTKLTNYVDYTLFYVNNRNVGTATVYAVGRQGTTYENLFATKTFSITKATPVITVGVTNNKTVIPGKTRRLIVTSNMGTLTYTASTTNISVSAVDDGVSFTGNTEGTAVINASIAESDNWVAVDQDVLTVTVYPLINNFDFTGTTVAWTCPYSGYYELEVWGAKGGNGRNSYYDKDTPSNDGIGGNGGYSHGKMYMISGTNYYVTVGGEGAPPPNNSSTTTVGSGGAGGFNGGGAGAAAASTASSAISRSAGGGGATDISLKGTDNSSSWNTSNHLYSRIIVAGGGGSGTFGGGTVIGGYGGGSTGGDGVASSTNNPAGKGGTQTAGGQGGDNNGAFGKGGDAKKPSSKNAAGAGGGGWYGGGAGTNDGSSGVRSGGGGGSGYVYTSSTASNYPLGCLLTSDHYLTNASTVDGSQTFKSPTGVDETGHSGDGYARITWVSEE